jgi:hypothetical protein
MTKSINRQADAEKFNRAVERVSDLTDCTTNFAELVVCSVLESFRDVGEANIAVQPDCSAQERGKF